MRFLAFITLIGTVVSLSTPAWSAWERYVFEDFGIAKDFPAEPERSEIVYTPPRFTNSEAEVVEQGGSDESGTLEGVFGPPELGEREIRSVERGRPAVHFEVEVDNIIYRMTVVDFQDRLDRSANILLECVSLYETAGVLVSNFSTTVGGGVDPQGGTRGREVTVDLPNDQGRVVGACYFTKGNLYWLEAHILPEHGDMNAIAAIRFTNALEFSIGGRWYEDILEHGEYPDDEN